jgi:ABC-type multidrug transport system ATPase subunit
MHWVSEFCNRAMLLEKGRVVAEGQPEEIVRIHQDHSDAARAQKAAEVAALLGSETDAAGLGFAPVPAAAPAPVEKAGPTR